RPDFKKLFREMLGRAPYLRQKKFDMAIDMRGDMRNRIVMFLASVPCRIGFDIGGMEWLLTHQVHYKEGVSEVEHFIDLISSCTGKGHAESVGCTIPAPAEDKEVVGQFLKANNITLGQDVLIIVHPVSRWPAKEWPKEKFAALCDKLISQRDAKVIMVGAVEDAESINKILAQMKEAPALFTGTLVQLSALLKKADLFIGNDTAPMHMAALLRTPTIALFGPTDPEIYGPYGEGHSVVRPDIPCLCSSKKICRNPKRFCMDTISVERVFGIAEKYINRLSKEPYKMDVL
ncbi:MAG: glycosyltransferase family 9 protein, partial [Candidatus Omnitrophica bacterium]|nr:glycosyltransferase family 9 protein [Candidatus Omnitrophota bacterium]MCG2705752.1 glycosyltransferase family 9 protein [Candidatus Omnitrophota bacterium]